MKALFVSVVLLVSVAFTVPIDEIEYNHKAVIKTLIKNGKMTNPSLSELVLPKSIEDTCALQGKFFKVADSNESAIKTIYIGRVNSCRAGGCSINNNNTGGTSEYFDYMVCFDKAASVVLVKVFNYQATHGHEVTAKGWLKQFVGHNANGNIEVGRNIDSISGATISVNGISKDIEEKTELMAAIINTTAL
ncbi:FMN-binding protein [Carboxylicivirga linearis]|uniref:FMN-binding protein n=1 Tax=Carboxylicivirga linearis TaxID=1628157 RepID=A0ABS5JUC7_9BACT|nr:FMN-binding protein [Carboxylicivirga linearis]MBS2097961.1 FMN-binding protein [Carboxylicivirga linearis]